MEQPLLSITIPTYNRLRFLKQTLDVLLPQVMECTEVVVSDNCSTDGTWEYLETLQGKVVRRRNERNMGADQNVLACLGHGRGQYVWILCDDDLPCSNAVSSLVEAIRTLGFPPYLSVSSEWQDADLSRYSDEPVQTAWTSLDRNGFLRRVSFWFTVASSIVIRRDCLDLEFVSRWVGSNLVPAAITLSTVGKQNQALVSDEPLVICRGGNSGGYDALTTFTRNTRALLHAVQELGFADQVLRSVYDQSLRGVVVYVVRTMTLRPKGVLNLFRSSWDFRSFYILALPALLGRLLGRTRQSAWRRGSVSAPLRNLAVTAYEKSLRLLDVAATASFRRSVGRVGDGSRVCHPIYLRGPQYVTIGDNFSSSPGLRIEAWDEFRGTRYMPQIMIGRNVVLNFCVHIGAIERIEIGDNVLVGSHVLITDHEHGDRTAQTLDARPIDWPLFSRGPVVVGHNVWIGEGACILGGVRIGDQAVIGANSVVTHDVEPRTIVAGVPAQVIGRLTERTGGLTGAYVK